MYNVYHQDSINSHKINSLQLAMRSSLYYNNLPLLDYPTLFNTSFLLCCIITGGSKGIHSCCVKAVVIQAGLARASCWIPWHATYIFQTNIIIIIIMISYLLGKPE